MKRIGTNGGDSSDSSNLMADLVPNLFRDEPPQLQCRVINGDSKEGALDDPSGVHGGASVDTSETTEGSLDASLLQHYAAFVKPPSLQAREIDPMISGLCSPALRRIPGEAGVLLARFTEIEAVHARLGAGTFGEVFHCTLKGSKQDVAVKVLHTGSDTSQKREVKLLGQLKHDKLVQFICLLHGQPDALVLELCAGGCLADVLHSPGTKKDCVANLSLQPRACAVLDVISAVEYLHAQRIIHRDIKPGNVFLTATVSTPMMGLPPVKLGDLGLARELACHMTRCTGTTRYMAPEILKSTAYDVSADIYSCGMLLYEVMSGKVPFGGVDAVRVVLAATEGQRPDPKDIDGPSPIVDVFGGVLDVCWAKEPADRPSAFYLAQCIKTLIKDM